MATATKERPILFRGPMVNAILNGHKTQTRRVIKPQPRDGHTIVKEFGRWVPRYETPLGPMIWVRDGDWKCPFGSPGDLLWVRENFCLRSDLPISKIQRPFYAADRDNKKPPGWSWKPSIHMPRWASRITLEITSVRVERLQAISEADAKAEGPECMKDEDGTGGWWAGDPAPPRYSYRHAFRHLWESNTGKTYPWASNPWVWAIEFRRLNP